MVNALLDFPDWLVSIMRLYFDLDDFQDTKEDEDLDVEAISRNLDLAERVRNFKSDAWDVFQAGVVAIIMNYFVRSMDSELSWLSASKVERFSDLGRNLKVVYNYLNLLGRGGISLLSSATILYTLIF